MNNERKNCPAVIRRLSRLLCVGVFLSLFALLSHGQGTRELTAVKPKTSEKRIALVIGNGAYQHASALPNPVNDANDMAATLKDLGFEVISGTNQTKQQIEALIRQFGTRLAVTKAVGLFFYAGHGISAGGINYLVPVDADIQAEDEIEYSSVSINFVLNKMAAANNGFNMVVLDACRNNPFAHKWRNYRDIGDKGGLARIDAPTGTLIAYATKPGDVAADGKGRNGLYTSALLKQMRTKNVEMGKMFQYVRADVITQSGGKQVPFDESSVVGDFYFAGYDASLGTPNSPSSTGSKPEKLPTAEDVLEKYFQALGGKTAINSLQSMSRTGDYEATINGTMVTGTVSEILKAPNKSYLETKLSNGDVSQEVFDGTAGWVAGSGGFAQMSGQQLEVKRRTSGSVADVAEFKKRYPQIKLKEKVILTDKETFVVEATPPLGKPDLYYFDSQTGLLTRFDCFSESSVQKGVFVPIQVYLEDYVEINGTMIPFVIRTISSNVADIYRFHSYPLKFNIPVDDAKFQLPKDRGKSVDEVAGNIEQAESLVKSAYQLIDQKKYDEAIDLCNKAIKISPNYESAYGERGFAYSQKGQFDKAIADYSTAIKMSPYEALLYFNRGTSYYKKNDFDPAIQDFNKAIELSPSTTNFYSTRCAAYFRKGQNSQALNDCSKAVELDSGTASLYLDRAVVYDRLGLKDLAAIDRKKYKELSGN